MAWHKDFGKDIRGLYRMREEYPSLRTIRNYYEALCDERGRPRLNSQQERDDLQGELRQRIAERDEPISDEQWLGDLLLHRFRLRAPVLAVRWVWAAIRSRGVGRAVARRKPDHWA